MFWCKTNIWSVFCSRLYACSDGIPTLAHCSVSCFRLHACDEIPTFAESLVPTSLDILIEDQYPFGSLGIMMEDQHSFGSLGILMEDQHLFGSLGILIEDQH